MTILDQIVQDTRGVVARRKREASLGRLEGGPFWDAPRRDFVGALRKDGMQVVAEVKKASPSQGVIREDYDPAGFAEQYAEAGAAAVSVLTEPLHFQGSLDDLARVREAVDVPLLRKDFVVDEYQLVEARARGADAVLLIATVLDRHQLHDLHQAADELGLACLVELYSVFELDRVDLDQTRVLGVNNRDLRTFEVDPNRCLEVFQFVPDGIVRVAESGLRTAEELDHLHAEGVHAALIGETFMRSPRPGDALVRLREGVLRLSER